MRYGIYEYENSMSDSFYATLNLVLLICLPTEIPLRKSIFDMKNSMYTDDYWEKLIV